MLWQQQRANQLSTGLHSRTAPLLGRCCARCRKALPPPKGLFIPKDSLGCPSSVKTSPMSPGRNTASWSGFHTSLLRAALWRECTVTRFTVCLPPRGRRDDAPKMSTPNPRHPGICHVAKGLCRSDEITDLDSGRLSWII